MTRCKRQMRLGSAAVCALAITASAGAVTPGAGGFSWSFQDTTLFGSNSAIAMRSGSVFPVVFTGNGEVASLYSSGWVDLTDGDNLEFFGSGLRASSSADGRVVAVNQNGSALSQLPFRGFTELPGFTINNDLIAPTVAAAFDPAGNVVRANQTQIFGLPDIVQRDGFIQDIAVSPNGDVGVVTNSGSFYEYNIFVGDWLQTGLDGLSPNGGFFGELSLTYDSLGRAHVLAGSGGDLLSADFNPQTGQFEFGTIATSTDTDFSDIAANEFGVVGTSYVKENDLFYAYREGNDTWASVLVPTNAGSSSQTGVTFDYEGLPVLSYNAGNRIFVAYDPVVVPEPTAGALLSLAGLALLRRRAA